MNSGLRGTWQRAAEGSALFFTNRRLGLIYLGAWLIDLQITFSYLGKEDILWRSKIDPNWPNAARSRSAAWG
jgi:hypothetical protein